MQRACGHQEQKVDQETFTLQLQGKKGVRHQLLLKIATGSQHVMHMLVLMLGITRQIMDYTDG